MKRTPLSERKLPDYTRSNEIANMLTHIVGAAFAIASLAVFIRISNNSTELLCGCIFAISMLCLYIVSSTYHGLLPGTAKKIMQVIDHCAIYYLIAGTYTPILLVGLRPVFPELARIILMAEWALAVIATVFTAIDHKRYGAFSMICYIGMGWMVILALKPTLEVIGVQAFLLLLAGGVSYTVGAVIYGLGRKKPVLHTVFHIFVVIGSVLHAICIMKYVY